MNVQKFLYISQGAQTAPFSQRGVSFFCGLIFAASVVHGQNAATNTAVGSIERVRVTDGEMSCAQILEESAQMDKLIVEAQANADKERTVGSVASVAGAAADVAGKLGVFGALGGLSGALFGQSAAQTGASMAQKTSQNAAQTQAERAKQASARKEHIVSLALAKECKASATATNTTAFSAPINVTEVITQASAYAQNATRPNIEVVGTGGTAPRKLVAKNNKVVVAGYRVAFVGRTGTTASGTGSFNKNIMFGGGTVTAGKQLNLDVVLKNIDTPLMQSLTERMYADFVAQLQSQGLEVLPLDVLTKSPHFAKVQAFKPKDSDVYTVKQFSDPRHYTVLTPKTLPMVFLAGEALGDRGLMDLGQMKGLMFSAMDAGATALLVQVSIDFADVSSSGRSRWTNNAEVDAVPAIGLSPSRSTYITALQSSNTIMGEWGTAAVDKPVLMTGDYAKVRVIDDPNNLNEVSKSLFQASINLGATQGTVTTDELRLFEADPVRYGQLALQAGYSANSALSKALR